MTKSYLELKEGQFLMVLTDLEGDKAFLKKSLYEYKTAYQNIYPDATLDEDDFCIVLEGTDNEYIQYPNNVVCLHDGDLTDKSMGAGSTTAHNMELVLIMLNTHTKYSDRMYSLIGNRETTKRFRLKRELNQKWYEQVLNREAAELAKDPGFEKKNTTQRPKDMIWVDLGKINFLSFLSDKDLSADPISVATTALKKELSLKEKFLALPPEEQDILYLKWMFGNSCGAPNLWIELTEELQRTRAASVVTDLDVLNTVKEFFMNDEGIYHQYLKHCQVGIQIENTLFTHSGVHDNSFKLPTSILALLDEASITRLFGKVVTRAELLAQDIEAENIQLVLEVLNTGFRRIVEISGKVNKTAEEIAAIDTMIAMGLPAGVHDGVSVINVPVDEFSNPISAKTVARLRNNGTNVPAVTRTAFGHWPIRTPQFVKRLIEGTFFTSVRMDTCNFRKDLAAVAFYMHKTKEALYMGLRGLNEAGERYEAIPEVTNAAGVSVDPVTLQVRQDFANTPGALVGCTVLNHDGTVSVLEKYDADSGMYTSFRQGGAPKFEVYENHLRAEEAKGAVARSIVVKQSKGSDLDHILNIAFAPQQPTAQPRLVADAGLNASFNMLMLSVRHMNKHAKILCALVLLAAVVAAAFAVAFGATATYTIGAAATAVGVMAVSMFMYRSGARSVDRDLQAVQNHELFKAPVI